MGFTCQVSVTSIDMKTFVLPGSDCMQGAECDIKNACSELVMCEKACLFLFKCLHVIEFA